MITGHKDAATFEQYRQIRRDAILQAGRKLEKHSGPNRYRRRVVGQLPVTESNRDLAFPNICARWICFAC